MRNLSAVAHECMEELRQINVPYQTVVRWEVNTRAKHRWGQCRQIIANSAYSININSKLLDERVPEQSLKKVIMHELLHTVQGGMCHTGVWKQYAGLVRRKLGYDIERTDSETDLQIPQELRAAYVEQASSSKSYVIQCVRCGYKVVRHKMCYSVEHPENCQHKYCGGRFTRVEI